jgi:hypothetical protein
VSNFLYEYSWCIINFNWYDLKIESFSDIMKIIYLNLVNLRKLANTKQFKNLLKKIELSSSPGRSTYNICCDCLNRSIISSLQDEWHRFMWASSWIFYYVFLYLFLSYTYVYFISLVLASFLRFTRFKYMIFIMSEKDSIFKSYQLMQQHIYWPNASIVMQIKHIKTTTFTEFPLLLQTISYQFLPVFYSEICHCLV